MALNTKKTLFQRQIPTAFGLIFLVVALIAGLLLFSDGTGVFAPRAAPETTPQNVKITNVRDDSFTVSFMTSSQTVGFVKYGTEPQSFKLQAADERDELTGTVGKYGMHHVVVRDLKPKTQYFFEVGTGASSNFINNGQPFAVTTAAAINAPQPASKTIYGSVKTPSGTPAEGSVVYITGPGLSELSALVKASGSWAISLAQARSADGAAYASVKDDTLLSVVAQGITPTQKTNVQVTVAEAQPVADLFLGQPTAGSGASISNASGTSTTLPPVTPTPTDAVIPTLSPDDVAAQTDLVPTATIRPTAALTPTIRITQAIMPPSALTPTPSHSITPTKAPTKPPTRTVVDLTGASADNQTVETTAPVIKAKAPPKVTVKITINSESQIDHTTTTDASGNFQVDLDALGKDLEPGEHTIAYAYTDPDTGEEVSKTYTFYVADTSSQIAQANTAFSSGDPYPITTPTPTKKPTITPTATASGELEDTSTRAAVVSTDDDLYQAGSASTTWMLVLGGMFFILTGVWSWWLASQAETALVAEDGRDAE